MTRRATKLGSQNQDPLSRWAQRLSLGFFLALTFALILFSKAETVLIERARAAVTDALVPVLAVLSLPVQSARDAARGLGDLGAVHERNVQLAEDNRRLREWQELARHLQTENARLKAELGYVEEMPPSFVTARVVADGSGAFARSLLINAGAAQAVDRDQPVVAHGGLVGRVARVGSRSARILLLTDLNSRIPVSVNANSDADGDGGTTPGERAILAGNNSDRLTLDYLPEGAQVAPGDRVTTSGHGGIFPPGLAVGIVARVEGDLVTVDPLVDYATLTHVRVLQTRPIAGPAHGDGEDGAPLSVQGAEGAEAAP
ncbi:MAG: rod shape-determining protein MreC [Alphaproteobacteria bacterium]|nr:rod shape-determining protein MreC [Alphaproteobacteria bacterium]